MKGRPRKIPDLPASTRVSLLESLAFGLDYRRAAAEAGVPDGHLIEWRRRDPDFDQDCHFARAHFRETVCDKVRAGVPVKEIADALGLHKTTVYGWVRARAKASGKARHCMR